MSHYRYTILFIVAVVTASSALAQSTTTGTLRLRNSQPETVSLSIPTAGVSSYTLVFPETQGTLGQALIVGAVTGADAQLAWTDAEFWHLDGTAVTTGGVGVGEQYLGSNNEQDLVMAANATELIRLTGVAGPTQGRVGIGVPSPQSLLDVGGTLSLSNTGSAAELRFFEPSASGQEYTAFRAADQSANITYTLPASGASAAGQVLTSDATGTLSWASTHATTPMGIYEPAVGGYQFEIPVGPLMTASSIPMVSMMNPPGTVIGVTVNAIDLVNQTLHVETSVAVGANDRIAWMILNP